MNIQNFHGSFSLICTCIIPTCTHVVEIFFEKNIVYVILPELKRYAQW